jgi:hypothetical protein
MRKKKILKLLGKAVKSYGGLFDTVCANYGCASCIIAGAVCDRTGDRLKDLREGLEEALASEGGNGAET